MIKRSEGQTNKFESVEANEEFFARFVEDYDPYDDVEDMLEIEDEELEEMLAELEVPHEADHVFNPLTGDYDNVG